MSTTSPRPGGGSTNVGPDELCDQKTIERVVKSVVSIHFSRPCSFDTAKAESGQATGFVVDAERGYILTNRHVVGPGPFTGNCVFSNHERCDVYPVYRDPVHDFAFLSFKRENIRHMAVVALKLRPDLAKVGVKIIVIGNDAGEKLSILRGDISRLDRNAPDYGPGYSDFNTNYIQAATGASGGSSGSPIVNLDGFAVALQAGGRSDGAATDFFLPLDRPLRALELLKRGEYISRGTIQTQWSLKPFDKCQMLGLSKNLESDVRAEFPTETSMLVAEVVLPQGPASKKIKVGDILVKINGELVTQFKRLDSVLDMAVDGTISVNIQRGGEDMEIELDVGNLHDITPDRFVSLAGAKFQALSYHKARRWGISTKNAGVYVCEAACSFTAQSGCLIVEVDNKPTSDLDTFIEIMRKIPDGKRIVLRYKFLEDMNNTQTSITALNRHWLPNFELWKRNDRTGLWDFKTVAEPIPAVQRVSTSAAFVQLKSRYPKANEMIQSIVRVIVSMPISLDGISAGEKTGVGIVVDAEQGLVCVSRAILPHNFCDISLIIADSIIVDASVKLMHPFHNYAIVQYHTTLVDAPVKTPKFSTELIEKGCKTIFVGMGESSQTVIAKTEVTNIAAYIVPQNNTTPRYRATNFDGIEVDTNLAKRYGSGVLVADDGAIQALWLQYCCDNGAKSYDYGFGFAALSFLPNLDQIRRNEKPKLRILDFEIRAMLLSKGPDMGVSEKWIRKIKQTKSEGHYLYAVKKVNLGDDDDIQNGDILLTLNNKLIECASDLDVMYENESLNAVVVRKGKEREIEVKTIATENLETDRMVHFCGATLQRPHHAVHQQFGQGPSEVYVSGRAPGSPAELHNVSALYSLFSLSLCIMSVVLIRPTARNNEFHHPHQRRINSQSHQHAY
jgi:S1-C subfamily serine protease